MNSDLANKICYLLEQNKLKCWIAPRNIPSGTNYIEEITEGIKSTKIVTRDEAAEYFRESMGNIYDDFFENNLKSLVLIE